MKNSLKYVTAGSLFTSIIGSAAADDLSSSTMLYKFEAPLSEVVNQSFASGYPKDNVSTVQTEENMKNLTTTVVNTIEDTAISETLISRIKAPIIKSYKAKIKVRSVSEFKPKLTLD